MINSDFLDTILPLIRKPGRYLGGEMHAVRKKWDDCEVRFALVFPDLYEIGMSHLGLQVLYHALNDRPGLLADRCFAPDLDLEEQLRRHDQPIFSLESRRSLADFDVIGITLPYELCFTNILTILDLAAIPFASDQRGENDPLVIGGGSCALNPEPVASFFDAVVLGDGEEVIVEIAELIRSARRQGACRRDILNGLAEIAGVYVPSFFAPQYNDGGLTAILPLRPGYTKVRRRILPGPPGGTEDRQLVPVVRPVHDRLGVEIARGCTRGCRFCQAGIIYRPVRERTVEEILQATEAGVTESGFEELALLSLSSGDYSCMPALITRLMDRFAEEYVSVSMPSMRVGTLTEEIMRQISRVRKTGFTIAPEAGTDRLREVINKGITEQDLLETCRHVFANGWNLIKFYFMIGLPTETAEDVDAIVDLARKARQEAGPAGGKVQINVSVGTFVPKAHTPFQWERQLSLAESRQRINHLKSILPRRGFSLKWHDPRQSFLEGVFARGDRRLAVLIEKAWQSGVRLDGWSEHFRLESWQQAAEECGINLEEYLQARDPAGPLAWDHLESGVDRDFLVEENRKARERVYTPDCRTEGCQQCGVCDFKTVSPLVQECSASEPAPVHPAAIRQGNGPVLRYRVHYRRMGDSRFYSHLETMQLIFRSVRRAHLPVLHSQGFNPTPKISFSNALPVGTESEVEFFDMEVAGVLKELRPVINRLNRGLPPGMEVRDITGVPAGQPEETAVTYLIFPATPLTAEQRQKIEDFLGADSFIIRRVRKNRVQEIDARPQVSAFEAGTVTLRLVLISIQGRAGASPRDLLQQAAGFSELEALLARVQKTGVSDFSASA